MTSKGFTNQAIPALSVVESPIEGRLVQAMFDEWSFLEFESSGSELFKAKLWMVFCVTNHLVGEYRMQVALQASQTCSVFRRYDLVIFPGFADAFAVELDGRDFHSSPDAAQRDRASDRQSLRNGISVVRFAGSEVYKHASSVLHEIVGLCVALDTVEFNRWSIAHKCGQEHANRTTVIQ